MDYITYIDALNLGFKIYSDVDVQGRTIIYAPLVTFVNIHSAYVNGVVVIRYTKLLRATLLLESTFVYSGDEFMSDLQVR